MVGSYSGDLYVLRLDNQTKEIVEESRIDLENYPFKPVVGIAQSPKGDIYFGAYAIFKSERYRYPTKKRLPFSY